RCNTCRSSSFTLSFCPAPPYHDAASLSLHDALPIYGREIDWMAPEPDRVRQTGPDTVEVHFSRVRNWLNCFGMPADLLPRLADRSEEHTSELQSRFDLVCRLLLEKKKTLLLVTIASW